MRCKGSEEIGGRPLGLRCSPRSQAGAQERDEEKKTSTDAVRGAHSILRDQDKPDVTGASIVKTPLYSLPIGLLNAQSVLTQYHLHDVGRAFEYFVYLTVPENPGDGIFI
jgi:hypothetical protein